MDKENGTMPKRKDESDNTETLRIRISPELKRLCNDARLAGAHKRMAESAFVGYLIEIGLKKYQCAILPLEQGEETQEELTGKLELYKLLQDGLNQVKNGEIITEEEMDRELDKYPKKKSNR
jgi:hypothetical protein